MALIGVSLQADEVPMSSPWIVALYQAGLILGDRIRVQAAAQVK